MSRNRCGCQLSKLAAIIVQSGDHLYSALAAAIVKSGGCLAGYDRWQPDYSAWLNKWLCTRQPRQLTPLGHHSKQFNYSVLLGSFPGISQLCTSFKLLLAAVIANLTKVIIFHAKTSWTTISKASQACHELNHCGCKKGCTRQCKCVKAALKYMHCSMFLPERMSIGFMHSVTITS